MCQFCGCDVCPTTMECSRCGFDFGICSEDPYADPTCPRCAAQENGEDFQKAMPEFCREMRFGN
jgi:hypothetical protein